jgi:prepilin peptidase CpaA
VFETSSPVAVSVVAGAGAITAGVDLYTRRVPNALTFGIATIGLGLAVVHATPVTIVGSLAGLGVGLALMLPGHIIGATGAGDVKLFAALGTLLGPSRTGMAFLYMALAGAMLAIVIARRRGRLRTTLDRTAAIVRSGGAAVAAIESPTAHNRFAYAPAIVIGALAAALGF